MTIGRFLGVVATAAAICVSPSAVRSSVDFSDWHTPPEKWQAPRVYHTPFDETFSEHIRIAKDSTHQLDTERVWSSNNAYYFTVSHPNTMKEGPWNTTIYVFNEREYTIWIDLLDHASYSVTVAWINEKLMYIAVWWGRVIGTSLIFDVESEQVLYKEMVHNGVNPFQQAQEWMKTHE